MQASLEPVTVVDDDLPTCGDASLPPDDAAFSHPPNVRSLLITLILIKVSQDSLFSLYIVMVLFKYTYMAILLNLHNKVCDYQYVNYSDLGL